MRKLVLFSIIAIVFSANALAETSKWEQLENIPDCRVWNAAPEPNDSAIWTGICRDGHAEGKGELVWQVPKEAAHEKHVYEGHMVRGKLHGYGIYTWPDGSRYDGMWSGDNRHGKGVYTWPDGSRYEGMWKNDYWHGKGTTFDTFGNKIYTGDWSDGQRSGYGIDIFNCPQNMPDDLLSKIKQSLACGASYEGNWKDDRPIGEGTLKFRYFGSYSVIWTNGCLTKFYILNIGFDVDRWGCKGT